MAREENLGHAALGNYVLMGHLGFVSPDTGPARDVLIAGTAAALQKPSGKCLQKPSIFFFSLVSTCRQEKKHQLLQQLADPPDELQTEQ